MPDPSKTKNSSSALPSKRQTIHAWGIDNTGMELEFDLLLGIVARIFEMPLTFIGLSDSDQVWSNSQHENNDAKSKHQIASLVHHTLKSDDVLIIEDLRSDDRFQKSILITAAPNISFYAGAPLIDRDGNQLGRLAMVDMRPRDFNEEQRSLLNDIVKLISGVLEKRNQAVDLGNLAMSDHLTGLPNRTLFNARLEREIRISERTKSPLTLLIINLDRFKEVNDALGYRKGDMLLIEAARRICECISEDYTIARLGGDEFAVVLPLGSGDTNIQSIAERIVQELNKPFMMANDVAYVSASIGITHYPEEAQDVDSLLTQADQAMNKAKKTGRDQFCFFTASMKQDAQEKLALKNDLRQAIARKELHVYYQPIIDLETGKISKGEALLRWKHPKRGMISPTLFIPLAEESGLIHAIGDWVFQEAVTNVSRWYKMFGHTVQIGINKSPIQLAKKAKLGEEWGDKIVRLNLPNNSIKVEITEGVLLKDSHTIKMKLMNFQDHGVQVSIDDFGTGFSSLSYLKKFNVDFLKIDQSFISQLTQDETDRAVTEAIIMMAHKLGIKTIAEGVETKEQRDLLVDFGCDYAQGFLYSHALPANEFEQMLAGQA